VVRQVIDAPLEEFIGCAFFGPLGAKELVDTLARHGFALKCIEQNSRAWRRASRIKAPSRKSAPRLDEPIPADTINKLIFHGVLAPEDRDNQQRVRQALTHFVGQMLSAPRPWFSTRPPEEQHRTH
jgi:hypothetical protein